MKTIRSLFLLLSLLFVIAPAMAQDPGFDAEDSQFVRVVRNDDGSRSIFERTPEMKGGMKKQMFDATGVLLSVTIYRTGKWGQMTSCKIYDGNKNELYKVAYGYEKTSARLVQERMYDSKTGKLIRIFIYTYDELGNRNKPFAISYPSNLPESMNIDPSAPEKDPFGDGPAPKPAAPPKK